MNELQKIAMEKAIDKQFNERRGWIEEEIFKGCLDTDSTEQVCAKMIINGVSIATKMAAALAIDFLHEAEVVELSSDDEIRKRIFSVVEQKEKG